MSDIERLSQSYKAGPRSPIQLEMRLKAASVHMSQDTFHINQKVKLSHSYCECYETKEETS